MSTTNDLQSIEHSVEDMSLPSVRRGRSKRPAVHREDNDEGAATSSYVPFILGLIAIVLIVGVLVVVWKPFDSSKACGAKSGKRKVRFAEEEAEEEEELSERGDESEETQALERYIGSSGARLSAQQKTPTVAPSAEDVAALVAPYRDEPEMMAAIKHAHTVLRLPIVNAIKWAEHFIQVRQRKSGPDAEERDAFTAAAFATQAAAKGAQLVERTSPLQEEPAGASQPQEGTLIDGNDVEGEEGGMSSLEMRTRSDRDVTERMMTRSERQREGEEEDGEERAPAVSSRHGGNKIAAVAQKGDRNSRLMQEIENPSYDGGDNMQQSMHTRREEGESSTPEKRSRDIKSFLDTYIRV